MPLRKKFLGLSLLLLCSLQQLPALEIARGNLKLVLHEGIGRFSLYARSGEADSAYTPLFVAQDPRTTVMSVIVGDRLYRLGESGAFAETVQTTAEGARFCWNSEELKISEDFIFVPDGVAVRIALSNESGRELTLGMRICLDTYLGEKSSAHFSTSRHPEVSRELDIPKEDMVRYWKSAARDKERGVSLYSHTSGDGVTVPDRIIFANWKRISDTSWKFETSSSRNFNLMPYSINDSAVCQYYSPRRLASGQVWNINLLFTTAESVPALQAPVAAKAAETQAGASSAQETPSPSAESITLSGPDPYRDLMAINALIDEINMLMLQQSVSADELERLRGLLAALKSKTAAYPGSD